MVLKGELGIGKPLGAKKGGGFKKRKPKSNFTPGPRGIFY